MRVKLSLFLGISKRRHRGGAHELQKTVQIEITCRQVWREVSNFLENDLAPELRVRIERHLSICNHCRALMDGTRNTVTIVADERALDLPDEVRQRLYRRWMDHLKRSER
jgi:predicted anti-sigma-YlaC factor YlaD